VDAARALLVPMQTYIGGIDRAAGPQCGAVASAESGLFRASATGWIRSQISSRGAAAHARDLIAA
jgi:hypothetical protein